MFNSQAKKVEAAKEETTASDAVIVTVSEPTTEPTAEPTAEPGANAAGPVADMER